MTDNFRDKVNVLSTEKAENVNSIEEKDVWSAAYTEAVRSMGEKIDNAIVQGDKLETALRKLSEENEKSVDNSFFRRGLRKLEVPLRTIRLALDITKPLLSIEPTAASAVGIVSCVTAVSSIFVDYNY